MHEYITPHSGEERADGYIGRIVAFCNGFATFPMRGRQRDDILPGLRVTRFGRRLNITFVAAEDAALICVHLRASVVPFFLATTHEAVWPCA